MSALDGADALARWWVDRYTATLPPQVAERRRAEIRSDLWEQRAWATATSANPAVVTVSIVRRVVAGMAADLWWRRAQLSAARGRPQMSGVQMWTYLRRTWWQALAVLLGGIEIATGVYAPFEDPPGGLAASAILAAAGLTVLAGVVVRRRRRVRGDLMIAVGVLPVVPWYWTYVFPIAAVAVLAAAFVDAADARSPAATDATPAGTPPRAADHVRSWLVAAVIAALVGGVVVGSASVTVVLVSPLVALLIAHALVRRRTDLAPAARAGMVLVTAGAGNIVLTLVAVAVSASDDGLPATVMTAAGVVGVLALLAGATLLVLGRTSARWS